MRNRIKVSIIIVSFNTRGLTLACLRSIYRESASTQFEIIVVDNASTDGSVEAVAKNFPGVRLISNSTNRGFSAANNQGLRIARGEYILLLNPDTEILDDAIGKTIDFADCNPQAGAVGCRSFSPDGVQQLTVFHYLRLRDLLFSIFLPARFVENSRILGGCRYPGADLDSILDVEVITGCFMLVKRELIDHVGLLDEDFFMYSEEAEWCFRIRKRGWRILYFPGAKILHHGHSSGGQYSEEMKIQLARSHVLFLRKTRGPMIAYLGNFLMFLRYLPRTLAWIFIRLLLNFKETLAGQLLRQFSKRFFFHFRRLNPLRISRP